MDEFVVLKDKTIEAIYENFKSELDDANLEFARSLNKETKISNTTKVIIVGTITPHRGKGYFYTANNRMYEKILDRYFNKSSFEKIRQAIINTDNKIERKNNISKMKKELNKKGIAFLDVIKSAIRIKENASDKAIVLCSIDDMAFQKIKQHPNIEIICTSQLAQKYVKAFGLRNNVTTLPYFRKSDDEIFFEWSQKLKSINI